jgi:hypothetical protein
MRAMQLQDPMKEFRESMRAIQLQDPMKEFRESMKAMQLQDPMKEFRESLKAMQLQDPMKEFRESLKVIQRYDPMKGFRESLDRPKANTLIDEWRRSVSATNSLASIKDVVSALSDERWQISSEDVNCIQFVDGGDVICEGQAISNESLSRLANELLSNAYSAADEGIGVRLDKIFERLDQPRDPIHQKLLQWIVYPLIVGLAISFVNPVADYYIKKQLTKSERKSVLKDVSRCFASFTADAPSVSGFQIVSVEMLNVRRGKSINSSVVGALYLGDIVEAIEKGRKWTLVEWCGTETNASLRGWVFSRYLKRIR